MQPEVQVQIPNLVSSPIWSLSVWPIVVHLLGRDMVIPAMPAQDWLAIFMDEGWDPGDVLDLLPEYDQVLDAVMEWDQVALDIISAAAGRPWWVALKLIAVAHGSWQILGPAMISKVKASEVSLSGWLDVLLIEIVDRKSSQDAQMFVMQLEIPPPGIETPEPEMSAEAFLSLA